MLPKALLPFFLSFVLSGGLIAFPGTVLDTLLKSFGFTPTLFGVALFVQGSFALLGTRAFSKASLHLPSLHALEGAALLLPAIGIAIVYLCDPVLSLLSLAPVPASLRLVGYAALGAGVGGSGILNNAFALRGADTTRTLGFLNMAFTAGAVLACLSLALYTVSRQGAPSFSIGPFSPSLDFLTPGAPGSWLALAGLSGTFIGASYSFVLAMLTGVYSGLQTSRAAFAAAQCGVAGAVLMPPALGAYIDATSFTGGLSFVFVTMVPFTLVSFVLFSRSREPR